MLASFGSGSPFWSSFKSNKSNNNNDDSKKHNTDSDSGSDSKKHQNQNSHNNSNHNNQQDHNTNLLDAHSLQNLTPLSPTGSSFNPLLMPETSYDDLFPSSMELLVLDELVSQLRSKIAEESANNARSSFSLNRSSSMRSRPRPLSGLGIGGLTGAAGTNTPNKRHSRSQSRSSVMSIDSVGSLVIPPPVDNKCYELYPYCEVVGEHIIKLAENATHWSWAMNCFNNLSQIYSTLDSLFLDKSPALYTMTIMGLMACHMCKALKMRGSHEGFRSPSTVSETMSKKQQADTSSFSPSSSKRASVNLDTLMMTSASNGLPPAAAAKKSHRRAKSSVSAIPSIINKGGTLEFTDPSISEQNENTTHNNGHNHLHDSEEPASDEPARKLNKKELEQLNNDLCDHILSAFSTLVTSQSHSSTLNLVLGQTIVFILGNIQLTPKFVKAFFEKLRSSQRLFWYPRSQVLRQWRLYWLQVVMDRMLVYTNYYNAQHGIVGSVAGIHDNKNGHNSHHGSNSNSGNAKEHVSATNSNRNSRIIHPTNTNTSASGGNGGNNQHSRSPSVTSINFTLENLNLYNAANGGNWAGNTNSVVSTATNDSESTGVTAASSGSSGSPELSASTSATTSTAATTSTTTAASVNDVADDSKTIVEEDEYEPDPYLLPIDHHNIPTLTNLKKIVASCVDELFVGVGNETDSILKQHTENVFGINGQRYVYYFIYF